MTLSREARLTAGITLLTVPTIVYGGLTVLGVVTGVHGLNPGIELTAAQQGLYRAGHAHAGVLVLLSLIVQVLLDDAVVSSVARRLARVTAPLAAILLPAGFFGIAHTPALSPLLWAGALSLCASVLIAGVGLVRSDPSSV